MWRRKSACARLQASFFGSRHTIDRTLELLTAGPAIELAYTGFLVDLNGDGIFVVAKKARELRGEGFFLSRCA